MEQTTVRLPPSIKKRMKALNRPDSDIIRDALRAYLKIDDQIATVGKVKELIEEHERAHHSREASINNLIKWGGVQTLMNDVAARTQNPDVEQVVNEPISELSQEIPEPDQPMPEMIDPEKVDKRVLKIQALESLLKFLGNNQEITSGAIAKDTGLQAKLIGRWFREMGMEPKNTRVNNVSGRYWGFAYEDTARKELARLKKELQAEADKEAEIKA